MKKIPVTAGPDGRIEIPGIQAGQTVTIHVEPIPSDKAETPQRSPEEQEKLIQEMLEAGRRVREQASPEWLSLDHGEWLYGPDGLPR
ncbi:MAG: hypothetical protein M3464_12650 [Chloroflexota bacterium]|nr:hypothetical protein [Chloroflexota bacterium]